MSQRLEHDAIWIAFAYLRPFKTPSGSEVLFVFLGGQYLAIPNASQLTQLSIFMYLFQDVTGYTTARRPTTGRRVNIDFVFGL